MADNPKRRRRIVILGVAASLAVAGAAGAFVLRRSWLDEAARRSGDAGRAAFGKGDYAAAAEGLTRYLQRWDRRGATAEDHVLLARAVERLDPSNRNNLLAAISHLHRALELDPTRGDARADLLRLFRATGETTEALETLDALLAAEPTSVALYEQKRDLLEVLRRYEPALVAAKRVEELAPEDIEAHARTLRLFLESEAPEKNVDDWIAGLLAAHPKDVRFGILRAAAFATRHDPQRAKEALDSVLAASASVTDAAFLQLLVDELDHAGRFADSLDVLERVKLGADVRLRRERLRRLWCARRLNDVIDQMAGWKADEIEGDPEVAALFVTALRSSSRDKDAEPLAAAVAARADAVGKAWSGFLEWTGGRAKSDNALAAKLAAGVAASPASAVLWEALGDVRTDLGDPETGLEAWNKAAAAAFSWFRPFQRMAEAYLAKNQWHMASELAEAAYKRAPTNPDVVATYIRSSAAGAGDLSRTQVDRLLASMKDFETRAPGGADAMLPSYVGVLAHVDRAAAEKRLLDAIESGAKLNEITLLRLASVASEAGIPLTDRLLDASEARYGVTPQLAFARAMVVARAEGDALAPDAFDAARRRAAAAGDPVDWELTRASLLDAVRDGRAGPAWIALADAHPEMLRAQLGALASDAAWRDHEAVARIIERLHGLTGDDGVTWRLDHARWVLRGTSPSTAELADVAAMLDRVLAAAPRSTYAHVLLGEAFERLGNLVGAEEQLRVASELTPGSSWIGLQIARLAQKQGKPEESLRQLDKVIESGDLSTEGLEQAAYLLAVQGDARRGAGILERTIEPKPRRQGALLLAQLYANLGRYDRTVALCRQLLDRPDLDVLELMAGAYEAMGDKASADAALARLDSADAKPGERELVRARHAARWGSEAQACEWSRKAVDAAPTSVDAWRTLLVQEIATGDASNVAAVLDDRRAADVDPVRFAVEARPLCMSALADKRLRTLLVTAVSDSTLRPTLLEVMRTVSEGWNDRSKRAAIVARVRASADSNLRIQALQFVAQDLSAEAGDLRDALEIAKRTASQFPDSPAAASNWAQLLGVSGRWEEALAAGRAWRARYLAPDPGAETLIADALLHLGRPSDAAAGLEPLVADGLKRPDAEGPLLLAYCVAAVRCGRAARAAEIVSTLAVKRPDWRLVPLAVDPGRLGDAASALAWMRMCEGLVPDDAASQIKLARAWTAAWQTKDFRSPELLAGARNVLGRLASSPTVGAEAHMMSGTLAFENHEGDLARKEFAEALRLDPAQTDARNNLAYLLIDAGQWKDAVDEAKNAVAASPKNPEYRDTLAAALRKGGQFDEAKKALSEAVLLDPANPEWHANLCETLVESGNAADARREAAKFDELVAAGAAASPDVRARIEKLRPSLR